MLVSAGLSEGVERGREKVGKCQESRVKSQKGAINAVSTGVVVGERVKANLEYLGTFLLLGEKQLANHRDENGGHLHVGVALAAVASWPRSSAGYRVCRLTLRLLQRLYLSSTNNPMRFVTSEHGSTKTVVLEF